SDFADAFERCDVICAPTAPTTAFPLGAHVEDPLKMYLMDVFTIPASLAGLPCLSMPCGVDAEGLPVGLQMMARPLDEGTLVDVGRAYEAIAPDIGSAPGCGS
ncbi:MAG: amidase family protein, partial [Myxococcota bacterium]|nr:amidase family protein [Myxococcota bacterium]